MARHLYWTLFGVGALLGGLSIGALRQLPLWPVMVGIVVAWGLLLLPFGLDVPVAVTVACFTVGGAVYGPFVPLSVTLMQAKSPRATLAGSGLATVALGAVACAVLLSRRRNA